MENTDVCTCAAETINRKCPRHWELVSHSKDGLRRTIYSIDERITELKAMIVSLETMKKQLGDIL